LDTLPTPLLRDILKPLERTDGRRTASEVYEALQSSIISGRIPPGTVLPQTEVAKVLNVSRTPVREAMRMLQEAGLLVAEPNYRSRVVILDPIDIEAVYIKLIVLEALAVSITAADMSAGLARKLYATLDAMDEDAAAQRPDGWLHNANELHEHFTSGGGDPLITDIRALRERTVRYQIAAKGIERSPAWKSRNAEHRKAVDAMCAQECHQAAGRVARYIAATGAELLNALSPDYDAFKLRAALAFATFGCDLPPLPWEGARSVRIA
jgi:DNA-binding GntR family transcriptional regulator